MGEPIVIRANTVADSLGVTPKRDPDTGQSFYLWDDMFPMGSEGLPVPVFGAQETARVFFGRGADWLRFRYHSQPKYPQGYFVLGRKVLEPKRTESGQRRYTLADIERMAHALAENDALDGEAVETIVSIALNVARLYRAI